MKPLENYKLCIGPMSKNVVDACIDFANTRDISLMFIPSRRQVEDVGGYANGWTTKSFAEYVKSHTDKILIMRDHGGPKQGDESDDGLVSLCVDCAYFDLIHLDPWKAAVSFEDSCERTKTLLNCCYRLNPDLQFEIGTEQSIFRYEPHELERLLTYLRESSPWAFEQVRYAVIQSGTSLEGNTNTGKFDATRLTAMIEICREHGILTKEHNGDYLPIDLVKQKFQLGLNAINIAPEFGQVETQTYLREIAHTNLFDSFYEICYNSGKWKKWLNPDKPIDKIELINVCGHYVLSNSLFFAKIRSKVRPDIDGVIKANITKKLEELHGATT